jgi:predicted Zn-dependent protease with MMP-like domain
MSQVQLAELAVNRLISVISTGIAAELTAIATDRGDGLSLPEPSGDAGDIVSYPIEAETANDKIWIEVFEQPFTLDQAYTDSENNFRATWVIPCTVRVTLFNREQNTSSEMSDRIRRYSVALYNVVAKNNTLGGEPIQMAWVQDMTPHWGISGEDEQTALKVQYEMTVIITAEEVQ